ncbi:MAG: hypothetical protein J5482_05445 [Oscillospiraceae bacterium]|nr:hypothetical protein [Oscillospiraceae bacterium]
MEKSKSRITLRIILSVLAAIAIWLYVDIGQATTVKTTIRGIPVEFSGENGALADNGLMLLDGYDATVDLRIEGPRSELWKLSRDAIRIVADTSGITDTGVQSLSYQIVYPDSVSGGNLKVDWRSAYTVTVTVGDLYTKEVPVYCDVTGPVADGFLAEEAELDPVKLLLRGQRDDLLNISYAKVELNVEGANKTVVQGIAYTLYDYNDIPVENSNIRADTKMIQVTLPVKTTKTVPLRLIYEEAPGSTREQMECTVVPSSVTLKGDKDTLANIDFIVLDTLYLQDLQPYQTLSYPITVPDGTELMDDTREAVVTVVVSGVIERTLAVTDFAFDNLPEGLTAAAVTEQLRITLRGLTEEIEALSAEDLTVRADLSAVNAAGNYTVPVTVSLRGYSNVSAKGSYQIIVNVTAAQEETDG